MFDQIQTFILSPKADKISKRTGLDIQDRYELYFLEIGLDKNHVNFKFRVFTVEFMLIIMPVDYLIG